MASSAGSGVGGAPKVCVPMQLTLLLEYKDRDMLMTLVENKRPFMVKNAMSRDDMWEDYCKFMYLKIMMHDTDSTKLSPPCDVDTVWHLHVLCTKAYEEFVEFVKTLNPLIDGLHHNAEFEFQEIAKEEC